MKDLLPHVRPPGDVQIGRDLRCYAPGPLVPPCINSSLVPGGVICGVEGSREILR